ncbi:MAG: hypothetical protein HYY11_09730 [Candidatus Methylomirabilis oxyfera]|nr:hypothetical protein [Candidatus Methylomirabilis oxyfera]
MRYDVPIYDPFSDRGDDYYHPASDAAQHLVQVALAYRDIARLFRLLERSEDYHDSKLLTKFAVVELLSMDDHLNKLVGLALSGKTGYSISPEESAEVKRLYGKYTRVRKPLKGSLQEIRKKVGAHRDPLDLVVIAQIWDNIDPVNVAAVTKAVPDLLESLTKLNIYCWTKHEETDRGPVRAYISPMVWDGVAIEQGTFLEQSSEHLIAQVPLLAHWPRC